MPRCQVDSKVKDFVAFLKADGKPALAALIGNAYRWINAGHDVELFLDHSHANLIPMLKMPRNHEQLMTGLAKYFGESKSVSFRVGNDPEQIDERQRDAQALEEVEANPKVKFVLEKFKGTIMQCQILEKE